MEHTPKRSAHWPPVHRQITLYYIYGALVGTWFASGIALFFNLKYLSIGQLGLMDAAVFALGLVADIPTGVLADRWGRRRIVILGVVLGGVGYAVWGVASAGWMVVVGNILYAIGASFQSGAADAMMYDYLKGQGQDDLWGRVSVNSYIIARVSYVASIVLGGIAYSYLDRLPFLLRGATFFLMLVPLHQLAIVDRFQHGQAATDVVGAYWDNLKAGVGELFTTGIAWMTPIYVLVQGVSYTVFTAGLLRSLLYQHAGLAIRYQSAAISGALALTILLLTILKRYEARLYAPRTIFILSALCALGFVVNLGRSLVLSVIGLTVLQVATYAMMPMLSAQVNRGIASNQRATTLSTANFMQSAFYVLAAPMIGYMAGHGLVNQTIIGATAVVCLGLISSTTIYRIGDMRRARKAD
jgi:MFS family permease